MLCVAHGILPSDINLVGRFVDIDPMCSHCGNEIETIEHALCYCEDIRRVWDEDLLGLGLVVDCSGDSPLAQWFERGVACYFFSSTFPTDSSC
ncbi:hypothetical protein ACS0TY_015920 [Phlomoides rotata]